MSEHPLLRKELLELGMEDRIPLPEAVATAVVVARVDLVEAIEKVSIVLQELLHDGLIVVLSGPWGTEPESVPTEPAMLYLRDPRRYSFEAEEADGADRVYYVNVENFHPERT